MLLNVEWPRIKRDAKDGNVRQITSPSFAHRESQHQGDNLSSKDSIQQRGPHRKINSTNRTNADGGVSEEKELVHAGDDDGPGEADYPCTEGGQRHRGIVCVGNRGTDLWIWGFILERKGRWVKVWVVVVIDSNVLIVLLVFRQNVSGTSTLQTPGREEISEKNLLTRPPPKWSVLLLSNPMDFFSSSTSELEAEADIAD
jgi:hypothetical protein